MPLSSSKSLTAIWDNSLSSKFRGIISSAAKRFASTSSRNSPLLDALSRSFTTDLSTCTSSKLCRTKCPISCAIVNRCRLGWCSEFTPITDVRPCLSRKPETSSLAGALLINTPRNRAINSTFTGGAMTRACSNNSFTFCRIRVMRFWFIWVQGFKGAFHKVA